MKKTTITEDRREIITVLKAFLVGGYDAEKLIYSHVSYENIEGSVYSVKSYEDEISFTSSGRLWLNRMTESFTSNFDEESMENIHKRITQGCIKADQYLKELREFPINGELTIIKEVPISKQEKEGY